MLKYVQPFHNCMNESSHSIKCTQRFETSIWTLKLYLHDLAVSYFFIRSSCEPADGWRFIHWIPAVMSEQVFPPQMLKVKTLPAYLGLNYAPIFPYNNK